VLFSGGRGSGALSAELAKAPRVDLTLIVNGYDDGKSTGEIREFLGDSLGPSDYRKNAARLASRLDACEPALVELLEIRLPEGVSPEYGHSCLRILIGDDALADDPFQRSLQSLAAQLEDTSREELAARLRLFDKEAANAGRPFNFSDCCVGNIVFAGCFLRCSRCFNAAIVDYCSLMHLPEGILQNATDGTNAYLVGIDVNGRLLAREAEIVDATRGGDRIEDIYLIDHPVSPEEAERLTGTSRDEILAFLGRHSKRVEPNDRALEKIREADLIVYAPGTQHSSLFPSYLTPQLGEAVAGNLKAIKLLITNLEEDADIAGVSAVELIDRAAYYLRDKDRLSTPTPCLITHYLINDPRSEEDTYVPLGRVERLEDPRLVRIAYYEDRVTGRHDAAKVVYPFLDDLLSRGESQRIAVFLLEADSPNKISQTMIEMVRACIEDLPFSVEVFFEGNQDLDGSFAESLPFAVHNLAATPIGEGGAFRRVLDDESFDYVVLFESSGMYKGEDIVHLLRQLEYGRLDAIWGSRRLSIEDVHMAYRLLHRRTPIRGAISYFGSHVLSLAFLALYGRYIADTLSGARAIRTAYLRENQLDPQQPGVNFRILSVLLRDRAEVFETPVHYFPLSPEKVRRTTIREGLGSLATVLWYRFKRMRYQSLARATVPRPMFGEISVKSVDMNTSPEADRGQE
jgi:2-phospho-L-lactate transferase/gluconeogenesis factor (CofD/UPF0052 family)